MLKMNETLCGKKMQNHLKHVNVFGNSLRNLVTNSDNMIWSCKNSSILAKNLGKILQFTGENGD